MLKSKKVEKAEGKITEYDAYSFEENYSVGEHFINFYVPWIADSVDFEPIWDQLIETYKDIEGLTIAKYDVSENESSKMPLRSSPQIVYLFAKEEQQTIVDAREYDELVEWIEKNSNAVRKHRKNQKREAARAETAAAAAAAEAGVVVDL